MAITAKILEMDGDWQLDLQLGSSCQQGKVETLIRSQWIFKPSTLVSIKLLIVLIPFTCSARRSYSREMSALWLAASMSSIRVLKLPAFTRYSRAQESGSSEGEGAGAGDGTAAMQAKY